MRKSETHRAEAHRNCGKRAKKRVICRKADKIGDRRYKIRHRRDHGERPRRAFPHRGCASVFGIPRADASPPRPRRKRKGRALHRTPDKSGGAFPYGDRDPSGCHDRQRTFHRPRLGSRDRRDRDNRRQLHDIPGSDSRRHREGNRKTPSDARK